MSKHNKKRNVGLVYEMLLQYITENVMDNNHKKAQKAVKIIERRFNKKTELYKEFRLANALANSTVSGTHIAAGILSEAKSAARNLDCEKLKREKSMLIKDINYILDDKSFFHRRVNNFRDLAAIQNALNEWKLGDKSDLIRMIEHEKRLVDILLEDKKTGDLSFDSRSDKLVFKLLSEKMNEKYSNNLLSEQKDIIRNYAIYANDSEGLKYYLTTVKNKTVKVLKEYKEVTKNKVLLSKISKVIRNVKDLQTENIDDKTIKKYLTLINLKDEILKDDK